MALESEHKYETGWHPTSTNINHLRSTQTCRISASVFSTAKRVPRLNNIFPARSPPDISINTLFGIGNEAVLEESSSEKRPNLCAKPKTLREVPRRKAILMSTKCAVKLPRCRQERFRLQTAASMGPNSAPPSRGWTKTTHQRTLGLHPSLLATDPANNTHTALQ